MSLGIVHWLIVAVFMLAAYMLPTWVALLRRHRQAVAIAALNLFLGWSFVGWVLALVWALVEARRSEVA